jgi:pimeloyl-ACP methyl ester carboxylesterase
MKERFAQVGPSNSVFAIVTEPDSELDDKPAIVLLNAGLMHRIGPFRMNVRIAREVAELGFPAIRIDCSGKGDSPPRADAESYREAIREDITAAFDHLQETSGSRRFVLVGLCSGADDAYDIATRDDRVCGVVLLDGYAYRTPKFYLRRYGPRIVNPIAWLRLLGRAFKRLGRGASSDPAEDVFGMTFPPKDEFERGLREIVDKGGAVLIVHSCGWSEYFNYPEQFGDAFPALSGNPAISVEYNPEADHTYSLSSDRMKLIRIVVDWIADRYT